MKYLNSIVLGDCKIILKSILDNSIDTCITDPPYELGFMSKKWDSTGIAYDLELWKEIFRILKPGGHLLSFGGSRTYHRMTVAIEDAGFEIRDQIIWIYGSGFPKSFNIGKAIDELQGNKREIIEKSKKDQRPNAKQNRGNDRVGNFGMMENKYTTKGVSEYEGWGTALKPAHEPIVLARKQLSEKSIAENCLKWGVGGINIDGCRIEYKSDIDKSQATPRGKCTSKDVHIGAEPDAGNDEDRIEFKRPEQLGRFPANLIHDGSKKVIDLFPNTKSGFMKKGTNRLMSNNPNKNTYGEWKPDKVENDTYGDEGSASRFFYCAKASKKERNKGCEGLEDRLGGSLEGGNDKRNGQNKPQLKPTKNNHPTVKPISLMKYLIKLVTRENQIVLDPFAGSGTTCIAAKMLKRKYIGIEKEKEYFDIAEKRLKAVEETLF